MLLPSNQLSSRADLDSFEVNWFSRHLAALGEPPMNGLADARAEAYRFLWLRSFHRPVVVRVQSTVTGARVVTAITSGAGGYEPGTLVRRDSFTISRKAWEGLRQTVTDARLWSQPAEDSTRRGFDGAEWIFEGQRGSRYILAARWSPDTSQQLRAFRNLGLSFLRLGHVSLDSAVY